MPNKLILSYETHNSSLLLFRFIWILQLSFLRSFILHKFNNNTHGVVTFFSNSLFCFFPGHSLILSFLFHACFVLLSDLVLKSCNCIFFILFVIDSAHVFSGLRFINVFFSFVFCSHQPLSYVSLIISSVVSSKIVSFDDLECFLLNVCL